MQETIPPTYGCDVKPPKGPQVPSPSPTLRGLLLRQPCVDSTTAAAQADLTGWLSKYLYFTGAGQYQGHLPGSNPGSGKFGVDEFPFDPKGVPKFTKDITIHFKDVQNTFEYYQDPIVTSFERKSGPSIGGTQMIVSGLGFMPRKNHNGNTYFVSNKIWVRCVDFQTKDILATRCQQYIFDSSHVTKVTPTFGPVKHKCEMIMDIEGLNFKCPDQKIGIGIGGVVSLSRLPVRKPGET